MLKPHGWPANLGATLPGSRQILLLALCLVAAVATLRLASVEAGATSLPEIRLSAANRVPRCVTPERLMAYVRERNPGLDRRYARIAFIYAELGEVLRVRWDYAFFQAMLETNFLKYRRPDGTPGDVKPSQNNFAGIGATGGGVPGERFPDIQSGVLAQLQHLVAYSGERVASPVARRTREWQGDIIAASLRLKRAVKFSDLTKRWAADRNYGRSIATLAQVFEQTLCDATAAAAVPAPERRPAVAPPAGTRLATASEAVRAIGGRQPMPRAPAGSLKRPPLGASPAVNGARSDSAGCRIFTASYGGTRAVLISSGEGASRRLTVLGVKDGAETELAHSFIADHAPGGQMVGEAFETRSEALKRARELCP